MRTGVILVLLATAGTAVASEPPANRVVLKMPDSGPEARKAVTELLGARLARFGDLEHVDHEIFDLAGLVLGLDRAPEVGLGATVQDAHAHPETQDQQQDTGQQSGGELVARDELP